MSDALALIAVVAALFICLHATWLGKCLRVMDHPDNERKHHAHATPLVGGIAILVPLCIWLGGSLLNGSFADPRFLSALLICAAGVGVTGFADDQASTSPLSRVLSLIVFVSAAFVVDPQLIAPGLNWASFETSNVPVWAFCALMVLSAVGVVNAVNMADGQNGLVPSMFVIWSACLMLVGNGVVATVSEVLFFLSLVVLAFNLNGKLFLGDCGSYGVTFVLGLLTMLSHAQGSVAIETIAVWFFIPVADCLRLLITRLLRGRSPSRADTDHFHHRLQHKLGKQYGLGAYIGTVAVSSLVAALAPHLALVCMVVLTAIYFSFASIAESATQAAISGDGEPMQGGRPVSGAAFGKVVPILGREKLDEVA
jgi:UDP-GlcNAc:undecaprenyl-phosphate GlcNAc-1-phosphate transferase